MRRCYAWSRDLGKLVEITQETRTEQCAPMIVPDLPPYLSPVTGQLVDGRKARRNDLARTQSRPWEGKEQELKESARQAAYAEQRRDVKLNEGVQRAYHQRLTPQQRREIEGR